MDVLISLGLIFLHMTLTASLIGLVVLVLRALLRRVPKKYTWLLWLPVLFRMVCPLSFSTAISILSPLVKVGWVTSLSAKLGFALNLPFAAQIIIPFTAPKSLWAQAILMIVAVVWISGTIFFWVMNAVPYLRLKERMKNGCEHLEGSFYLSERLSSSLILGFFHPRVYLPKGLTPEELHLQMVHAQMHLRRLDYFFQPLWFIITVIHWCNPLAWVFHNQMLHDLEHACDEMTLDQLDESQQEAYFTFLLSLANTQSNQFVNTCPLAIGEKRSENRITHLKKYRRISRPYAGLALVILCILMIILLSNPLSVL